MKFLYRFETRRKAVAPLGEPVKKAEDVIEFLRKRIFKDPGELWREVSVALFLDNTARIIGYEVNSVGGHNCCTIDPLPICRTAVSVMSDAVIHVHNHPNNNPRPSQKDIEQIEKLKKALSAVGCKLLDAVILADDEAYSFAQEIIIKK